MSGSNSIGLGYQGSTSAIPGNAQTIIGNTTLGTALMELLGCEALEPGSDPSYQVCKTIYSYHPLGAKMVDGPIRMAQSQEREIAVPGGFDNVVIDAFKKEWANLGCSAVIAAAARTSRIYGIGSLALMVDGESQAAPIRLDAIAGKQISFNVLDPLNTSGSLVLSQDPNSAAFMQPGQIVVQGRQYHKSRTCTVLNEEPLYIQYTNSAFGFSGRSVYQRALFPLKSFIQTMMTDDMISRKAGLLIAKQKSAGSIVDAITAAVGGIKRQMLQWGTTGNVMTVGTEDAIESLNLMNIDGAGGFARNNILKNIAVAADIHASFLNQETLAEGFGEGTEDAKAIARQIDRMRVEMGPLYAFMDQIVMYRAWSPEFFATVQASHGDELAGASYEEAFSLWRNGFSAQWPNLLTEPDSEKSKTQKVTFDAIVGLLTVMLPVADPINKAALVTWAADNLNAQKLLFPHRLELDADAMATYEPPTPDAEGDGGESGGESRADSAMGQRNSLMRVA